MSIQYVAFDVETPNRLNNRISSIGISLILDDGSVQTKGYLVNPECDFDTFNSSLTGITPTLVENAPLFTAVWAEIEPLFINHTVVAHNATFDLCVLQKTLSAYNITTPRLHYLCTLKIARGELPQMDNHKLSTLSSLFGIQLKHHDAGSDSEACACILKQFIEAGVNVDSYASIFDGYSFSQTKSGSYGHRALCDNTVALNELNTLVKAISCDGILAKEEIDFLIRWMTQNASLKGNYPYDRIFSKLAEVLEDGVITPQEHDELLHLFQTADNPVEENACACKGLDLSGKNICLSGEFDYGSKDMVSAVLIEKGASVQQAVTRKTNVLIVGGQGSSAWSSGNYGSKIKKALELQAKGIDVIIIRESDFFDTIGV